MNTDVRPRILVEDVPPEAREAFEGIPGTLRFIDSGVPVHESDYDLLVSFASQPDHERSADWHLLAFGATALQVEARASSQLLRRPAPDVLAKNAYVADGLDAGLRRLLQQTVVDVAAAPPRRSWRAGEFYYAGGDPFWRTSAETDALGGRVTALVHLGAEKYVYAIAGQRHKGVLGRESWFWALPDETTDHRAWLLYVLGQLHLTDPERFPGEPDWKEGSLWAPYAVAQADAAVDGLVGTREQVLAELDRQIEDARTVAHEQRQAATLSVWRLLTEHDDPLVEAVRDTLRDFGFTVKEMDEPNMRAHGSRLEDLRVEDPNDSEWEALVEVKGYTNGAKVNDVPQIVGRPSTYFAADKGRPPRAVWHIVNVQRGVDPSLRATAIPNDNDLERLAEANGALIDTRDLFRARSALEAGDVTQGELKTSLRQACTRWVFPKPTAP